MQGHALLRRQRQQAGVAGGIKPVAAEQVKGAVRLRAEIVADRQIDTVRRHIRRFKAGEQPQVDLRMLPIEVAQPRRQPVAGESRGGVDDQLIGFAVLIQTANADRQLLQHHLRGAEQIVAGVGQRHAAAGAEEQRLLQKRFEAADLLADGRLGKVQFFGSLMKTAQARRRFETAQRAQRGPVF